MNSIESPPRFKNISELTNKDLKKVFTENITAFVTSKFDELITGNLGLTEG